MATTPQLKANMHIRISSKESVDVKVQYDCGCGFRTSELLEAVKHSGQLGHTMSIRGSVMKEVRA